MKMMTKTLEQNRLDSIQNRKDALKAQENLILALKPIINSRSTPAISNGHPPVFPTHLFFANKMWTEEDRDLLTDGSFTRSAMQAAKSLVLQALEEHDHLHFNVPMDMATKQWNVIEDDFTRESWLSTAVEHPIFNATISAWEVIIQIHEANLALIEYDPNFDEFALKPMAAAARSIESGNDFSLVRPRQARGSQ